MNVIHHPSIHTHHTHYMHEYVRKCACITMLEKLVSTSVKIKIYISMPLLVESTAYSNPVETIRMLTFSLSLPTSWP